MPADYLPHAAGVMFAGEDILSAAGYIPGSNRPRGWHRHLAADSSLRPYKHKVDQAKLARQAVATQIGAGRRNSEERKRVKERVQYEEDHNYRSM